MKLLYINACVREESRTYQIADALLKKLEVRLGVLREEVTLEKENLKPLSGDLLIKRTDLIQKECFDHEMFRYAHQFAQADIIVIAAPYWDGSFPAILKTYIENIYVTGIVSAYGEDGMPKGLCKGQKLYYVTTAGGPYNPAFSYDYIADLAKNFFGIEETELIKAEMLDVWGFDAKSIVVSVMEEIKEREE